MRYFRCGVLVFLVVCYFMGSLVCAGAASSGEKYSSVSEGGYKVDVELEGDRYLFRVNDSLWSILKDEVVVGGGSESVRFFDVNADGVSDVFVKLYEARAEGYYALFVSKLKEGEVVFVEHGDVFGAPYVDEQGRVISIRHDGPFSIIEKYQYVGDDLVRKMSVVPMDSDLERVISYDELGGSNFFVRYLGSSGRRSAIGCVAVQGAVLFSKPAPRGVVRGELSKGDYIIVIDAIEGWLKVRYGNGRTVEAWVAREDVKIKNDGCG